jgi:hypothetical protein
MFDSKKLMAFVAAEVCWIVGVTGPVNHTLGMGIVLWEIFRIKTTTIIKLWEKK